MRRKVAAAASLVILLVIPASIRTQTPETQHPNPAPPPLQPRQPLPTRETTTGAMVQPRWVRIVPTREVAVVGSLAMLAVTLA